MSRRSKLPTIQTPETVNPVPADGVAFTRRANWVGTVAAFVFGIAIAAFVGAAVWPYEAVARGVQSHNPQRVYRHQPPNRLSQSRNSGVWPR